MKYIIVSLVSILLFSSCSNHDHSGHDHDSEGNHITNSSGSVPVIDYTIWTPKTELFVEFPALVVGKQSRFVAHLTTMDKHKAIATGKVTASLIVGNKGIRKTVDSPNSPGIFTPVLEPVKSGNGRLEFVISTDSYKDTIVIASIPVFDSVEEAKKALTSNDSEDETIEFLKEQAWKMEFQTQPVEEQTIYNTIRTTGIWQTTPNNSKSSVANANGNIRYVKKNMIPGQAVKKGEVIMEISSSGMTTNNLSGELELAKINLDKIEANYNRKKDLHLDNIIPKVEFEKIEQEYLLAKTRYKSLSQGYSASGYSAKNKRILAPISGFISEININNGAYVNEGDPLFSISNAQSNILKIQVSPGYAQRVQEIDNIWYKTASDNWREINSTGGKVVSVDKMITETKPNLNVFAQINGAVKMPQGSMTAAIISTGDGQKGLVVPENALLESYGKYSVIVQLSGVSFEERNVVIGKRNGDMVQILDGLEKGEIVVSTGSYQVKMQAMSGQAPAHSHAH